MAEADAAAAAEAQAAAEQMAAEAAARQAAAEAAATAAAAAQADAEAAAAAAAQAQADAEARATAAEAAQAAAAAEAAIAAELQAAAEADADAAERARAEAEAARVAAAAAKAEADAAAAAAEARATEAESARDAAQTAQATAEADAEAATMARDAAETARDDAVTAAADAEAAQTAAEERATAAETAKTEAEAAQAEAERARDAAIAAQEGLEDDAADMQAQSDSDAAEALLAALTSVTDANTDTAGDQNAAGDTLMVPAASKLQVSSDGMLTAKVENVSGYTMSDMAPDMIEGWRGVMFTKADGDTLVVYSDIEDDGTDTLFGRYTYSLPDTVSGYPGRYAVTNEASSTTQITWDKVSRPDNARGFAGTVASPQTTFRGTAHGIAGEFICTTGAACVAPERYSDGTVNRETTGIADWFFVPDEGASLYTDDPSFLTFGWWLDKDAGGNPANVRLVFGATGLGSGDDDVARTASDTSGTGAGGLRGFATYNGAAAGKYAMASSTDDTYEGGHFTAMATITADFDADLTPATAANDREGIALSGMIDNFMTGDTARPDWMVNLMVDNDGVDRNPVTPTATLIRNPALTGDDADNRRMLTSWSTGAAATGTGTWAAQWYGGVTLTPARTAIDTEGLPAAVVGTFNANIGTAARLQGAFGAMQDE
jgi:hypothetical protein